MLSRRDTPYFNHGNLYATVPPNQLATWFHATVNATVGIPTFQQSKQPVPRTERSDIPVSRSVADQQQHRSPATPPDNAISSPLFARIIAVVIKIS